MLGLVLVLVVIALFLSGVLFVGSVFLQSAFYDDTQSDLVWRAPVAAVLFTLFLAFWLFLDYRSPGSFNAIQEFAAEKGQQYDKFWSVKGKKETTFTLKRDARGRVSYRDEQGKPWTRSDTEGVVEAIVVEDKDGHKTRYVAELTPEGTFVAKQGEAVRYVEEGGTRAMTDELPGRVATTRWGLLLANLMLNALHFIVWFLLLWLLLRFQAGHAFGLAFVIWFTLTFFLPAMFDRVENSARERAAATAFLPTRASLPPRLAGVGADSKCVAVVTCAWPG